MAKTKTNLEPYNFGVSISRPLNLPGGPGFLLRLLIASSLLLTLIYMTLGRSVFTGYAEFLQYIMTLENPEDPEAIGPMMEALSGLTWPFMGLWLSSWAVMVSTEGAFHLNILKGEDRGLFPLRFAMPELGVLAAQLVVGLILMGVYLAGYFIFITLFFVSAFSAGTSDVFTAVTGIFAFAGFLVWMGSFVYAGIRLSPAAALSVIDGDIRTVEGWKLTRGRFWPMLGSYLVVWIAGYIAFLLVMAISVFLAFGDMSVLQPLEDLDASSDPGTVLIELGNILRTPRVATGIGFAVALYTVFTMFWRMFLWGIPNYAAELGSRDTANVFGGDD